MAGCAQNVIVKDVSEVPDKGRMATLEFQNGEIVLMSEYEIVVRNELALIKKIEMLEDVVSKAKDDTMVGDYVTGYHAAMNQVYQEKHCPYPR